MKKLLICFIFMMIMLSSCAKKKDVINNVYNNTYTSEHLENLETLEQTINLTSQTVKSMCVGISCYNSTSLLKNVTTGSGVVIRKEGNIYYILTNKHVITSSKTYYDTINVYLGDEINSYIKATIENVSKKYDLAILKIESKYLLNVVTLANNDPLLGSFCIACGSPYDLEKYYNTITIGNISSTTRFINEFEDKNSQPLEYLQHTASINSGSSGGGLFNLKGELIGINAWKINEDLVEGMQFSIPVKHVKEFLNETFK